jgi:hypothetical protein
LLNHHFTAEKALVQNNSEFAELVTGHKKNIKQKDPEKLKRWGVNSCVSSFTFKFNSKFNCIFKIHLRHRAYPVTQECANNVKVTPSVQHYFLNE